MMKRVLLTGLIAVLAHAAAPTGRYVLTTATVRDTVTNLTWQRTVSGTYTWAAAATYCQTLNLGGFASGWRLPTKKELETLVDVRVTNPAIDVAAFPATPASYFWTSTPVAGSSGYAWYVYFSSGYSSNTGTTNTGSVRCVR